MALFAYDPRRQANPSPYGDFGGTSPESEVFRPMREGNPLTAGYLGYAGYGPSPYQFEYGPYGFGSYGLEPGDAEMGFSQPRPPRMFDTVRGRGER